MIVVLGLLVVAKIAIANTFLEGFEAVPVYICEERDYGHLPDLKPVEANFEPQTRSEIEQLVRETFWEDPDTAVAVAMCESSLRPDALNDKNRNGTYDAGLFQINSIHQDRLDQLGLDKWNVEDNVEFARMLYDERGWQPWYCFTLGMIAMK